VKFSWWTFRNLAFSFVLRNVKRLNHIQRWRLKNDKNAFCSVYFNPEKVNLNRLQFENSYLVQTDSIKIESGWVRIKFQISFFNFSWNFNKFEVLWSIKLFQIVLCLARRMGFSALLLNRGASISGDLVVIGRIVLSQRRCEKVVCIVHTRTRRTSLEIWQGMFETAVQNWNLKMKMMSPQRNLPCLSVTQTHMMP
jgi:hypothetical protein